MHPAVVKQRNVMICWYSALRLMKKEESEWCFSEEESSQKGQSVRQKS